MKSFMLLLFLGLMGCDSTLSEQSSPEAVIDKLSENYSDNQKYFEQMIGFYRHNGELTFEERLLCSEDGINQDKDKKIEKACIFHNKTRTFGATSHNNNWLFPSYDSRADGFINAFLYLYTESDKIPPQCKEEELDRRSEHSICYISLSEYWYIEYRYLAIDE